MRGSGPDHIDAEQPTKPVGCFDIRPDRPSSSEEQDGLDEENREIEQEDALPRARSSCKASLFPRSLNNSERISQASGLHV
jgi:hypothetical protein